MLKGFTFTAILVGFFITLVATVRYYKMYRRHREEVYAAQRTRGGSGLVILGFMVVFLAGYVVGMVDVYRSDHTLPMVVFMVGIFFVGGLFIYAMVHTQIRLSGQWREKSLEVMRTFVNVIDCRDSYTKGHSFHVYRIVDLFYEQLEDGLRSRINKSKLLDAAVMHDIGKISLQDGLLQKNGPLAEGEWDQIKMHPANGKQMLDDTAFRDIGDWVLYHHERVDGNGYYNIPMEGIPVESRIIAIADTYAALCTDRVYRPRKEHEAAIDIIKNAAGSQFDTSLVAVFVTLPKAQLMHALQD